MNKFETVSNAPRRGLIGFFQQAFFAQQQSAPLKVSRKRRPYLDPATGAEAAMKYLGRKRLNRGSSSTLRKVQRAMRIEAGLRPLTFDVPGKRERAEARKAKKRKAS